MHVFITGIAGFLGSHIAEAMLNEGHVVSGIDDLSGGEIDNIPVGVDWEQCACQDLVEYGIPEGVDVVYHCAALPHEGLSVFSPYRITDSIFNASVAVFTAAIQAGVKRIIYTSSMSRYGANPYPFTEVMQPKPRDPYAIAKVASEEVLKVLCEVHDVEYVIAVPHNIIGPRQRYYDPYRNVVGIMINRVLQGQPVIVYGDGNQTRCFSDIRDVVPCFVEMATNPNVVAEVINVGPDEEPISINGVVDMLQDVINFHQVPLHYPARPCEVKDAVCSADKARLLLGYETRHTLYESLIYMAEWITARGAKDFIYHLDVELPTAKCPITWKEHLI